MAAASPLAERISSATASRFSTFLPDTATRAPSSASVKARMRPIPLPAPVTMADRPASRFAFPLIRGALPPTFSGRGPRPPPPRGRSSWNNRVRGVESRPEQKLDAAGDGPARPGREPSPIGAFR